MRGYEAIEEALIAKLLSVFSAELSASRVKASDLDSVVDAMFQEGSPYGVYIEFGGGRPDSRQVMSGLDWHWTLAGVFLIQYEGVETDLKVRYIATTLATMLKDDPTLGGVSPLARVSDIDVAEPIKINDTPFYWVPFIISAFDR